MSNKEEEKEIWEQCPDYNFVEVSNQGKVRTKDRTVTRRDGRKLHYKGRILKQQLNNKGYMYVRICVNGKTTTLLVHRLVAVTFLPNPDNLPEVNHKDNDPTNNRLDNLEWCTHKYNDDYKKNFGTSQAELFGKPVFAVNLKTGKILRFETQHEASRQLGVDVRKVNNVVKGKRIQTGGWWFTEDESEITEDKIQEIRTKMYFRGGVIAINIETSEIFLFESQSKAAHQLGVDASLVNGVIKGKLYKTGGYWWFCHADKNAVEKVRSKFGNEVAEKVEELMNDK